MGIFVSISTLEATDSDLRLQVLLKNSHITPSLSIHYSVDIVREN